MKKLLILIGNSAVGKMTVGQELTKITPFRLFHHHMMIEPVLEVFGSFRGDVIQKLRNVIFEEFAASDNYGLIFTYMWAFDMPSDWDYIESVKQKFGLNEEDVCYVELIAPQEVRLARNRTENRLHNKASKRDIEASNARLIQHTSQHRFVSHDGEVPIQNFIRIDNSSLDAETVAKLIRDRFDL